MADNRAFNPTTQSQILDLPPFSRPMGLTIDPTRVNTFWTCSDGLIASIDTVSGHVTDSITIQGTRCLSCINNQH